MSGLDAELAPKFAPFLGMAGIAAAMIFGCIGAAYGTAKSGISIIGVSTFQPDIVLRCIIPVIMSGIIAVYSLVIAVLIAGDLDPSKTYTLFSGVLHLASGLTVGRTGIAAGYCIEIVGDAGVRAFMEQPKVYTCMVLILIFAEVLGLYGLIVAILLNQKKVGPIKQTCYGVAFLILEDFSCKDDGSLFSALPATSDVLSAKTQ